MHLVLYSLTVIRALRNSGSLEVAMLLWNYGGIAQLGHATYFRLDAVNSYDVAAGQLGGDYVLWTSCHVVLQ